jgi:hypothetical protein
MVEASTRIKPTHRPVDPSHPTKSMTAHPRVAAMLHRRDSYKEYRMSFRRNLAPILFALAVVSIGSSLAAQVSNRGTSLLIPIAGAADQGGIFDGTLLIEQFVPQANGVTAVGTATGTLTANGTIRNLVMQVALPLDTTASRARLNTDAALAQASCEVLHFELGSASINVLGSTIGLNPVVFDIASTIQAGNTPAVSTAAQSTVAAPQSRTVGISPSTNTTQPGMVAQPAPSLPAAAPQQATVPSLGSLLCSVDQFRDVSNPSQLAQQLNLILTALGATGAQ